MATLKNTENWFRDPLLLNAGQRYCRMLQGEHSAILLTFIKLPFVIKIFVLSNFDWPFYTGFTVLTLLFTCFSDSHGDESKNTPSSRWVPANNGEPAMNILPVVFGVEQYQNLRRPLSFSNNQESMSEQLSRYVCKTCGKGFTRPSHLKIHERIHTGLRPFVCSFCNRSFNQKGNLKSHLYAYHKN